MGEGEQASDHRPVRRPGCRRQGRHDQGDHGEGQPAGVSRGRPSRAVGSRRDAAIPAALHAAFSAAGEIVIFDRSWYNRAGVEFVMEFCTPAEHKRFLSLCPQIEKYIIDGGIILIKLWLEVGMDEQERRFEARINDPLRHWKLSPMDLESYRRWYDYSRARDLMFKATSSKHAPWYVFPPDDKHQVARPRVVVPSTIRFQIHRAQLP